MIWRYVFAGRRGFYKKVKPLLPEKISNLKCGTAPSSGRNGKTAKSKEITNDIRQNLSIQFPYDYKIWNWLK